LSEVQANREAVVTILSDPSGGGWTARQLAEKCGVGTSRSDVAIFRSTVLKQLLAEGVVRPMDDGKPMVFVMA
jgi:hypothetical protein